MIKKIVHHIRENRLQKKMKQWHRKPKVINLQEAKSIAILADVTDEKDFEAVKKWVTDLKHRGKKVFCVGLYNQKTDCHYAYPKSEFDIYNLKQMKSGGIPDSPYLQTFISERRNLLVDLNIKNHFFLRYLAALCHAEFKCGIHIPSNESVHDVLVNVPENTPVKDFIKATESILNRMHPVSV
jgi:hypothetical protein